MDSTWFEVLVIILSIFLAIFLVLGIIILVKTIQILKTVKRITDHAEQFADNVEHIGDFFRKTATPIAFMKIVSNASEFVQKMSKKKGK